MCCGLLLCSMVLSSRLLMMLGGWLVSLLCSCGDWLSVL